MKRSIMHHPTDGGDGFKKLIDEFFSMKERLDRIEHALKSCNPPILPLTDDPNPPPVIKRRSK